MTEHESIAIQIQAMAKRRARWVRDDQGEMAKDLEMVGWEAYLIHKNGPHLWWYIPHAMRNYISRWIRNTTHWNKDEVIKPPIMLPLENWDGKSTFTPEKELILHEEIMSRIKSETESKLLYYKTRYNYNKNKTHCKVGHPLSGANIYVARQTVRSNGGRSCLTCRKKRSAEKNALRKIKADLDMINVLNLEVQKEIRHVECK